MSDVPVPAILTNSDRTLAFVKDSADFNAVNQITQLAIAAQTYAKQANDPALIDKATEIRLNAERRTGQILIEMKELGLRQIAGGARNFIDPQKASAAELGLPRLSDLGITHTRATRYQMRARLSEEAFAEQLEQAKARAKRQIGRFKTSKELLKEARERRERSLAEKTLADPIRTYNVILEDFEWDFEVYSRKTGMSRHASNHYTTASEGHTPQQIVELTKGRMACAARNCVLFMWATVPFLAVAIEVMRLRGFRYVSNFVWVKDKIGTGFWNRNEHEHMLIGVRGKIPAPAPGTQWGSIIEAAVREHSQKPEDFRELVEAYFPTLPKIELNCRGRPRPGWDAWGYEVEQPQAEAILEHEDRDDVQDEDFFGGADK